jgi:hypothetical protein
MIKLIDIFNEIKINEPGITWDKIIDFINGYIERKDSISSIFYPILKKYGYFGKSRESNGTIDDFLKTLSNVELSKLYSELKQNFKD